MTAALAGIRILDLTHFVAGPWATTLLADFGADVIKVEHPDRGDGSRYLDEVFGAGMSSYFVGLNRGKRSIALDLQSPDGIEVVGQLLEGCDVLIANFRPGVLQRLKLDYESLAQRHPRLIHVSVTAFGEGGPMAARPAMDIIVQAAGGVMGLTGPSDGSPVKIGAPMADYLGSYMAFSAIALALFVRQKFGFGQAIEVNLLDGQVSMLANFMAGHARTGKPEGPQGSGHPQIVPYQLFDTVDGSIVIGCLTNHFWLGLCDALELPELKADPRFLTNGARVAHRDVLVPVIAARIAQRTTAAWIPLLERQGVPCCEVSSLADVASSEQVRRNGMVRDTVHPRLGPVRVVGNPLRLKATPPVMGLHAPALGEHTEQILGEIAWQPAARQARHS
ncbi:MAG TPA: CoA transferase [Ramlibacter sp.]|nr:CoA transferase [Ramlibacter sp.]